MSDSARAETGASENHVDTILAEYFRRLDDGEPVDPAEIIRQHKEHADALREFFAAEGYVAQLAGPTVSEAEQVAATQDTSRVQAIDNTADVQPANKRSRAGGRSPQSVPDVLGRYQIKQPLGAGAMGSVYPAFDTELERQVALKIPRFQENESDEFEERFVREARAAANLRSPHICPVYDVADELSRYLDGGRQLAPNRNITERKPTWRSTRFAVSAVAALLLLALAAAIVIKLQTPQGTIKVEILDPKVKVTLDGDSITIDDSGQQFKVRPGEQELLVERGELTFKSTSFKIGKGQNTRLRVDFVNEELVVERDGKVIGTAAKPPPQVAEKPARPAIDSSTTAKSGGGKKTGEELPPEQRGGQAHFAPKAPQNEPVPDSSREPGKAASPDPAGSEKQPQVASKDPKPSKPATSDTKPTFIKAETKTAPVEAVITLPGKAELVRTGGAGRFLIFHVPEKSVLCVVDVVKRAIVKEITVPAAAAFAANREKLLIAMPRVNQLQRWDLTTLERDQAVMLHRDQPPKLAVMGASGDGPLALLCERELQLWDVQQMKPMQVQGSVLSPPNHFARYGYSLTVSADGKTFCGWTEGVSGQRFHMMRLDGQSATLLASPDDHSFNERWAMPIADGSMLVRYGGHVYARDLKPIPAEQFEKAVLLPTEDPRFLLAVRPQDKEHSQVTICTAADLRPVYTMKDIESVTGSSLYTRWGRLGSEPRVRYLHDV